MSVTQRTATQDTSQEMRCTRCNSVLPPHAIFCGTCGERVNKDSLKAPVTQPNTDDISERYRITSLIRRCGYTQLLLAMDTLHQRPVVIRDINISSLDDNGKQRAVEAIQREYDMLRRLRIPDVMPLIDLRYSHEHLFVAGGWPFPLPDDAKNGNSKAYTPTLQDVLQSGIGLPSEQVALSWLHRLSVVIGRLHTIYIFLGDLDPSAIVVSEGSYDGLPALAVSWLPMPMHSLLEPAVNNNSQGSMFMAPEAAAGSVEPRSDIYSLGALLYLLLTGSSPDEQLPRLQRSGNRLRELNPRISSATEAIVMRALAVDPGDRYKRVEEMEEALLLALETAPKARKGRSIAQKKGKYDTEVQGQETNTLHDEAEEVTVSIVSLQSQLARWQLEKIQTDTQDGHTVIREAIADTPTISTAHIRDTLLNGAPPVTPPSEAPQRMEDDASSTNNDEPLDNESLPEPMPRSTPVPIAETTGEIPMMQRFKERISGILPALSRPSKEVDEVTSAQPQDTDESFLKRLQRFLLGEQQRSTTAAALIETPLRIQPNQGYTIRIHLMGRNVATPPPGTKKGAQPVGLSAIIHDEIVHVEVRSSIFQNYAYVVQRADVHIPGEGFAAEVSIPMQPLSGGQNGRRERLHIFFMDEARRPLYEKPFAVEVTVSQLVQSGREGHTVLTIPI